MQKRGWHTRGYLPHFDADRFQFITIHLADSLPQTLLKKFERECKHGQLGHFYDREFQIKIEAYLDNGIGDCYLARPEIAEIFVRSLRMFHGVRYDLRSWVIMPNHGHILFKPLAGFTLSSIMKGLKGNTANQANAFLGRKGQFWHADYFDRFIRDQEHFDKTVSIHREQPREGWVLVLSPEEWRFSSAYRA